MIHDAIDQTGQPVAAAPRNVLKRVLHLYKQKGWTPIVAPEMEFFLVARNIDPLKNAVISVCVVATDSTAHNVIPQVVKLKGTARSLDPGVRDQLEEGIARVATNIAAAMGATAQVDYQRGYPVTMNDDQATVWAADVARDIAGDVNLSMQPMMGGEDFSYMLNERPGCYLFIGQGDTASVHHPAYDFNDAISPIGASFFARLVERAQPVVR